MNTCKHERGFVENVCPDCRQGYGAGKYTGGRTSAAEFYQEFVGRRAQGHQIAHVHARGQSGDMRDHHSFGFVDHTDKTVWLVGLLRWKNDCHACPAEFVRGMASFASRDALFGPMEPCPLHYAAV